MKKKRILSILLALVLIVSALPMTVFAAGEYSYIFFGGGIHTDDETATETLGGGTATWDAASATLTLGRASPPRTTSPCRPQTPPPPLPWF